MYLLLYKINNWLVSKLVKHENKPINETIMNDWLAHNYEKQGFKDFLTSRYATLSHFLLSGYKGDDVYKGVIAKRSELQEMELRAKSEYVKKFVKEKEEKDNLETQTKK